MNQRFDVIAIGLIFTGLMIIYLLAQASFYVFAYGVQNTLDEILSSLGN